jgi:hypothetical protein
MTTWLTVIVPVKNVAPWISEMLDSVLRQDVPDMEVIVVDDGSEDATPEIIEEYVRADARVRLLRSKTRGGGSARNRGLDCATGRYIVFADGDDIVPDHAYRLLTAELDRTGSDIAVARHLKFSSGATWEPMAKWYDVSRRETTTLEAMPNLLANRACWNRVFRSDFLRRIGLRFPDVPRANDILPVVSSLAQAQRIDLLPVVGYLYRDRPGSTSMSARASGTDGISSYLGQELAVAGLLSTMSDGVRRAHARVVLDADGWVHLERFLGSDEAMHADGKAVVSAVRALLDAVILDEIDVVRPERRVLWGLMQDGRVELARRFVLANRAADVVPARLTADLIDCWSAVIDALDEPGALPLDRPALVRDGLLTLLANRADDTDTEIIVQRLDVLAAIVRSVPAAGSEVLAALIEAIEDRDVHRVQFVSAARRAAPLVVDTADPEGAGLHLAGPLAENAATASGISLALIGEDDDEFVVPITVGRGRWDAQVRADGLQVGRRRVVLRFEVDRSRLDLPVVTARMPLPPITGPALVQPLADRRDGWRFLVDRVQQPRSFGPRVVSFLLRRLHG